MDSVKWPEMTQKRLSDINSLFKVYLFYSPVGKNKREITCTHCRETYTVSYNHGSDEYYLMNARHNEDRVRCPKCGAIGTAKSVGKAKGCHNLLEENRAVFVTRKSENKVILQCYECWKRYDMSKKPMPGYREVSRYILTPGRARQWTKQWNWNYSSSDFNERKSAKEPFFIKSTMWNAKQPADNSYDTFGLDNLKNTFLKYNLLDDFLQHEWCSQGLYIGHFDHTVSYLCRFAEYPQIEMLQKLGHYDIVHDIVVDCIKNRCNFKKCNPPELFRMSKEEYKEFAKHKDVGCSLLKEYRTLKAEHLKDPMSLAVDSYINCQLDPYNLDQVLAFCKKGITFTDEIKYLKRFGDKVKNAFILHKDYIDMAKTIKLDLRVHNVFFPKDLNRAHDLAAETIRKIEDEKLAKENKKKEAKAKELLKKYDKQYEFADGQFVIIVPHTVAEIVNEGKAMQHCVGGYAGRHLDGKLAICFLRKADKYDKSLYTIEMHGTRLQQVQGFHNYTPLTPEAKEFFNLWLSWVKAGSRRDKKGKPILPIKKRIGA